MAVPNPSKKRKRYDKKRKNATLFKYGTKANNSPDTPCMMAPILKQVLIPILDAYLPKTGAKINNERFAIEKPIRHDVSVAISFFMLGTRMGFQQTI